MVKQFHDTPPNPYLGKDYSEQEVREFFKNMHEPKDGCYSFHVPTWVEMCKEHPVLTLELDLERRHKLINEQFPIQPILPWPNTTKEQQYFDKICELQSKVNKFPWYELGCGFAIGSLFWGIMFALFGGN